MDLRQLKFFVCIVDCGSLSKAAEQLYITQPSLSLQIRALESELKIQLLMRSAQGVRPTEAGKTLYRHARTVLHQIETINQEIKHGTNGEAGEVAVGLPTTIATLLAHLLFNRIRTKFPGIHLHILEMLSGNLSDLLANERLDMAILFRDTPTRGVFDQPLFDEDLYIFGRAGLPKSSAGVRPMRELDGVPMVLPSSSHSLRIIIERSFARAGLELNVVADIESLATRMAIAREGSACTLLTFSQTLIRREDSRLFCQLVDPSIHRTVSICWPNSLPPNSASIAVYRTIIDLVRELADKKPRGIRLRPVNETTYEKSNRQV